MGYVRILLDLQNLFICDLSWLPESRSIITVRFKNCYPNISLFIQPLWTFFANTNHVIKESSTFSSATWICGNIAPTISRSADTFFPIVWLVTASPRQTIPNISSGNTVFSTGNSELQKRTHIFVKLYFRNKNEIIMGYKFILSLRLALLYCF